MTEPLSPDDRQRLETLFEQAVELPQTEHAAFVERECGPSGALRDELAQLLAGHVGEDVVQLHKPRAPLRPGAKVGAYKLLERIGEGGMGEVYVAEQLEPVVRRVALKVIKPGMDSAQVVARFGAERQALARMAHPHIAQVYDGGMMDDGRPYFVMEFVSGLPITEYCDRRKLSTRQRLDLFLEICAGVQHAHLKGIIHRDLKPSNLLVTEEDGRARAKIIDFGVARATVGRLAERTLHTMVGQIVGTLDYMSPEQADPTAMDIDTRSDIYSLGVVLYQLLSGLLPFEHSSAVGRPMSEVLRAIREQDPPTPSSRLRLQTGTATTLAHQHGTDERSLIRQLAGDLDWICLKALEKDPARRYQSAAELAADVSRHLAHEPVLARRPGVFYRARKFVRRHRTAVTAGVLVAASALAGVYGVVSARLEAEAKTRVALSLGRLHHLETQLDSLPAHPDKIPELEAWLARARELVAELDEHKRNLAEMRRTRHLRPAEDPWFNDRWLEDELDELIVNLTRFESDLLAENAVTARYGWSVMKRLTFAQQLEKDFAVGGEYAEVWRRELPNINAAYPGLELGVQMGLVPLARDPDAGLADESANLWEFAHLMTGEPAQRDAEGRLVLTPDTGVVLVLIPGGTFSMGEPDRRFQRQNPDNTPRKVRLNAYFLSKYELTQRQWQRLTGQSPSRYGPGNWKPRWLSSRAKPSLLHPVEQVSWWDCMKWLPRAGLSLPTEAQWEHGARGGTNTAYWSGDNIDDLQDVANLSDRHARDNGGDEHQEPVTGLDDGSTMHRSVGSYRANAFGLHDVHGNVYEWCLDGYVGNFFEGRPVPDPDPVAPGVGNEPRVYRGGSYRSRAGPARSAARSYYPPGMAGHALGVRPAAKVIKTE